MSKKSAFLMVAICLVVFLGILLINQVLAQDSGSSGASANSDWKGEEILKLGEPKPGGEFRKPPRLDATGKEFVLKDDIFDLKIVSSEEIHLILEAFPKLEQGKPISAPGMVSIHIEPITTSTKTETQITITGLEAFCPDGNSILLYRFQEGYLKESFQVDSEDKYSFTQDISDEHHLWISAEKSTLYIGTGKPSPYYDYDSETKTYTFKKDYSGTIVVVGDHITIDGNGHTFSGHSSVGISLYKTSYASVYGLTLTNYTYAIYGYHANWSDIRHNYIASNYYGIYLGHKCHYNNIRNNIAINANYCGVYLGYKCYYNVIKQNPIRLNTSGIINDYRAGGTYIYENTINANQYGVYLPTKYTPWIWHNNIYDNYIYNFWVPDSRWREISYGGKGNYWGHPEPDTPGFRRYHMTNPDCNHWHTRDSHPYKVFDGWKKGYKPGETEDPTPPSGSIVINSPTAPGPTTTTSPNVTLYLSITDTAPAYGPSWYMRFRNEVGGWSEWKWASNTVPCSITYSNWTLLDGAITKTVYAQFKSRVSYSSEVSDSIIYDSPPVIYHPEPAGGYRGPAFSFDGVNDYVGQDPGLPDVTNTFTMELWAYPLSTRATTGEANSGITGASGQRYAIYPEHGSNVYGAGHVGAGISIGTNGISVFEHAAYHLPSPLVYDATLTDWNHIVVVYVNKQPRLYLNGNLVKTGLTSQYTIHPSKQGIGGAYIPYGMFHGLIDEVAIYNQALSAEDISALHQGTKTPHLVDGLISWWSGDWPDDETPDDLWGSNHGALKNGAKYTEIWTEKETRRPTISASYFDKTPGINVSTAKMFLNNSPVTATATDTGISYTPLANLSNGDYTVQVEVQDQTGNLAQKSWQFAIEIANEPPECEVTSPITGTYISETIDINFVVTDTDNEDVTVIAWVNGITVGTTTVFGTPGGTPGTIQFDTTITDDNGYTIKITCDDGAGGTCTSTDVGITIDNTAPEVINITVNPDPAGLGDGVTPVNVDALTIQTVFSETMNTSYAPIVTYDPTGVIGPQACTGGTWSTTTVTNDTYTVNNDNIIDDTTGDGPATVTITAAQDLAGNTSVITTTTFVININPITIKNPNIAPTDFNPFSLPGETTTVSFVLSEPASAVTITLTSPTMSVMLVSNQPMSAGLNSVVWHANIPPYPDEGEYDLKIEAISYVPTDIATYEKVKAITIDYNLPIIYDVSDSPDPLVPSILSTILFSVRTIVADTTAKLELRDITTGDLMIAPAPSWTFPVPGPNEGNILEWDTTSAHLGVYTYKITTKPASYSKGGTISVISTLNQDAFSPDSMVTLRYDPTVATPPYPTINIEITEFAEAIDATHAIATADPLVRVCSKLYDITSEPPVTFPVDSPAILVFNYDPAFEGDVSEILRLRYWDGIAWVDVENQRVDLAHKQIVAEILTLSLFALFTGADTTPPVITITSPQPKEYYNLTDAQPTIIPITYTAEDPVIDGVTSGIRSTKVLLNGEVYTKDTIDLSNLFGENTLTVIAIDGSGNVARKTVRFTVVLPAIVTLKPESLKVNPGVLTAFVQFPTGYDVADITDAYCDGAKYESMELGPDETTMVFKFRRKAIEQALAERDETIDTEFVVRGSFQLGEQVYIFKGIDTIKKVLPGSVPPNKKR